MGSIQESTATIAQGLRLAKLPTINYRALVEKDAAETSRLLSICIEEGFFYLDMRDGSPVLEEVDEIYDFMKSWFSQSDEFKQKDMQTNYTDGYKPAGFFAGPYQNTRDCYESLKVSHRTLGDSNARIPESIQANRQLFGDYLQNSRSVTLQLLSSLSNAMKLPPNQRFENFHQNSQDSNSVLVLLKYPYEDSTDEEIKKVGHNKHTDIGTFPFLFTGQWGLQVKAKESDDWGYIEPRPGHAVINVGDSLRFLSNKKLRSCLHRVIPTPGQEVDRYTIAYFLRPSNDVTFVDSNGRQRSAASWHDQKYEVFKSTQEEQKGDTILTGGLEPLGKPHEVLA